MGLLSRSTRRVILGGLLAATVTLCGCDGLQIDKIEPPRPTAPPATATISPIITQTLDGITAAVQVVYADAHRIVLALNLDGPAKPHNHSLEFSWSDSRKTYDPVLSVEGVEMPWLRDTGTGMYVGVSSPAGEPLRGQGTLAFDTSGLQGEPQDIPIRLSLPILVNNQPLAADVIADTNQIQGVSSPSHILPFDFTFDAAFDPRKAVVYVGQTVEENDVAVTMDRLEITPSEARVFIHYSAVKPGSFISREDIAILADLTVHSGEGKEDISIVGGPDWACNGGSDGGECVFSYAAPSLMNGAPVDCTLTVSAGAEHASHVNSYYAPEHDRWVFHFTLPGVSGDK